MNHLGSSTKFHGVTLQTVKANNPDEHFHCGISTLAIKGPDSIAAKHGLKEIGLPLRCF
jgi:hypothetical protein